MSPLKPGAMARAGNSGCDRAAGLAGPAHQPGEVIGQAAL